MAGELWLELDDGTEVHLNPGDIGSIAYARAHDFFSANPWMTRPCSMPSTGSWRTFTRSQPRAQNQEGQKNE
jgi:hypothetical protein